MHQDVYFYIIRYDSIEHMFYNYEYDLSFRVIFLIKIYEFTFSNTHLIKNTDCFQFKFLVAVK